MTPATMTLLENLGLIPFLIGLGEKSNMGLAIEHK